MTRALLIAVLGLVALPAWAQTDEDPMTVTWTEPTLNAAACTATPQPIDVTLVYDGGWSYDVTMHVWWHTGNCNGSTIVTTGDAHVGSVLIEAGSTFFDDASFDFPDDLDAEPPPVVTTATVMVDQAGACGTTDIEKTVTLCFAIDLQDLSNNQTNDKVDSGEPFAQLDFLVDTKPPPAPNTPQVTALDSSLQVTLSATNTDDIEKWQVRYRPATGDTSGSCADWAAGSFEQTSPSTSPSISIDGLDNGATFEVCGFAIDAAANRSQASPTATGKPREECDFWECYPTNDRGKKIEDGYGCAAIVTPAWAAVLVGLLIRRRRRRA